MTATSSAETSSAETSSTDVAADGRVRRGARNRAALVDALLGLLEEGVERPTARQIAARAGVSVRTVFQHFDDVEGLYAAIAARQRERLAPLFGPLPVASTRDRRIEALVSLRARLFERIAPVRRASLRLAGSSPELTRRLAEADAALRHQLVGALAPDLGPVGPARADLVGALDLATSWEAWERLRRSQGLSVAAAKRATRALVFGALEASGKTGPSAGVVGA